MCILRATTRSGGGRPAARSRCRFARIGSFVSAPIGTITVYRVSLFVSLPSRQSAAQINYRTNGSRLSLPLPSRQSAARINYRTNGSRLSLPLPSRQSAARINYRTYSPRGVPRPAKKGRHEAVPEKYFYYIKAYALSALHRSACRDMREQCRKWSCSRIRLPC